eukprot:126821_1
MASHCNMNLFAICMLLRVIHGQRYHVVTDQGGVDWITANAYCTTQYGTQLATIYSTEDAQHMLFQHNSTAPNNVFWVGLQYNFTIQNGNRTVWQWVDDANYTCGNDDIGCAQELYWKSNQPDQYNREPCAGTWLGTTNNNVTSLLNNFNCKYTHFPDASTPIHFLCDGIGDGGCSDKLTQRSVLSNRLYACPGTIETGGVYGESAQQLCANDFHVCDGGLEAQSFGLTTTMCASIAQSSIEFFATKESGGGYSICMSEKPHVIGFNDIWGCGGSSTPRSPVACSVFNKFYIQSNYIKSMDYWISRGNPFTEATTVALTDSAGGGVLCCAGSDSQYTPFPDLYQCVDYNVTAHYSGHSIDRYPWMWLDHSGHNYHVNPLSMLGVDLGYSFNGYSIVTGNTNSKLIFPFNLAHRHTVINLCKYNGETQGRILQTTVHNSLFGFHGGHTGLAYEHGWITNQENDIGAEWLLSSQTPFMYRANGVDYTNGSGYFPPSHNFSLAINDGLAFNEKSDWACAEILVFNRILELNQIKCLEHSLTTKYSLSFPSVGTSNPTTAPSNHPTAGPTNAPSVSPTHYPTTAPSNHPTAGPTNAPSVSPTHYPSTSPSRAPSDAPTDAPSNAPSDSPTNAPSHAPSSLPSDAPSNAPSHSPTNAPSNAPSLAPSLSPSNAPSSPPTNAPSHAPSSAPSSSPSAPPTNAPSLSPSIAPSIAPSFSPTVCYDDGISLSDDGYEQTIEDRLLNLQFLYRIPHNKVVRVGTDFEYYNDKSDA